MAILCATAFGPRKINQAFRMAGNVFDSDLSVRTGFGGYALNMVGSNKHMMDYIRQDYAVLTEVYMAFRYEHSGDEANNHAICGLYNTYYGVPVFAICRDAGSPRELHAYRVDSGTTLVGIGDATGYSLENNTPYTIEFRWVFSDTVGVVQIWLNGTKILDVSGLDTKPGSVNGAHAWMVGNVTGSSTVNANGYWGEIICADAAIHNPYAQRKLFAILKPNGAGGVSQWTGAYTAVDEVPPDDSDKITVNTASQWHTFALENLPAEAESVDNVAVWARGRGQGAPTPTKFSTAIKVSSNLYGGYSEKAPAVNPWHLQYNWPLNPLTSAAWTPAEVNSLEAGVSSVA